MMIRNRQQFVYTVVHPPLFCDHLAPGTVPVPAGIIGYSHESSLIADIRMVSVSFSAAVHNGGYRLCLLRRNHSRPQQLFPLSAEYVSYPAFADAVIRSG